MRGLLVQKNCLGQCNGHLAPTQVASPSAGRLQGLGALVALPCGECAGMARVRSVPRGIMSWLVTLAPVGGPSVGWTIANDDGSVIRAGAA